MQLSFHHFGRMLMVCLFSVLKLQKLSSFISFPQSIFQNFGSISCRYGILASLTRSDQFAIKGGTLNSCSHSLKSQPSPSETHVHRRTAIHLHTKLATSSQYFVSFPGVISSRKNAIYSSIQKPKGQFFLFIFFFFLNHFFVVFKPKPKSYI